jgi:subtilisin family serine protease
MGPSVVLEDAVNYAHSRGAVIIAAAGNTGASFVLYPARYPNVVAVARTNSANNWDGSNHGPEIDLAAPGTSIYSSVVGGYDYKSGSSMSTGFVSGLASVLMSVSGNTSPDAIEFQMESTALDIEFPGWDEFTGAGLIQMDVAIQLAIQSVEISGDETDGSVGAGPGPMQVVLTNTPTPTWTVTSTLPAQTETFTPSPGTGSTPSPSEPVTSTPSQEESEVEAQEGFDISAYILPCIGIVLILLGILLAWVFRKKR